MGVEPQRQTKVQSVDDFLLGMKKAREEAEAALHRAAEDMARYYDQNRQEAVTYNVGDLVWLEGKDIHTNRPSKKLDDKRYGPFKVTKVVGPNAYELKLPASMKIHPVFNTVRLRPYQQDGIPGRKAPPPPPPVIEGTAPEWEVEYLKDSKLLHGKLHYLVKWKGYAHEQCTWEPEGNLQNAKKAIADFHSKHPSAPRKISATTFTRLPFQAYENFTEISSSRKLFDWTQGKHIEGNVP